MGEETLEIPDVRLRLSTILNYISTLYRFIASVAFTLIVIRRLDIDEYGIFVLGFSILLAISTIYNLWIPWGVRRYILKIEESLTATLILNIAYGLVSIAIFLGATIYYASILGDKAFQLLIFLILVVSSPITLLSQGALALITPHIFSIVRILFETLRVGIAYILVVYLDQGLAGAILALGIASITSFTAGLIYLLLKGYIRFRSKKLSKELTYQAKASTTNIFVSTATSIENLDRILITSITSSPIVSAFMGIAYIPRSIIAQGFGAITLSLYSKMLREPNKIYYIESIRLYLLLTGFFLSILLALSKPIVTFFNPIYIDAWIPLTIISLEIFILGFARIFNASASGISREDLTSRSVREILKTPLGRVSLYEFIRASIGIVLGTSIYLTVEKLLNIDLQPWIIATIYAISWIVSSIIHLALSLKMSRKYIKIEVPPREFITFIIVTTIVILSTNILGGSNIVIESFWRDSPKLALYILFNIVIYATIFAAGSRWFRDLIKRSIEFIVSKKEG